MIELANKIQNVKNNFENLANEDEILSYILRAYKDVCNVHDWCYEFHYIDDIKNNVGANLELQDFFDKHL